MSNSHEKFLLPGKIDGLLATLSKAYEIKNEIALQRVLVNSVVDVHEQWSYDNWDGGTYGHALTLTLPEDLYVEFMDDIGSMKTRICDDIRKLNNVRNENIDEVFIEMATSEHSSWREISGVLHRSQTISLVAPDALARIWGDAHIRIFLSHRAEMKRETGKLKEVLAKFGVSCFVAHEDIEPAEEWQREIENALQSMDGLVALLTEDFHESNWTDQEIGIALGRGVPVVSVCLPTNPYGFIGRDQGIRGCSFGEIGAMASKVYSALYKRMSDKSRLIDAAIEAYACPINYDDSCWRITKVLENFQSLSPKQVDAVLKNYRGHSQNRGSSSGMKALVPLLTKWTGRKWSIVKGDLHEESQS